MTMGTTPHKTRANPALCPQSRGHGAAAPCAHDREEYALSRGKRRRHPRTRPDGDTTMDVASAQHMTRTLAEEAARLGVEPEQGSGPAPTGPGAEGDPADEIATGMAELGDEPIVDNTPVPDSAPAVPDAFTDADPDDEGFEDQVPDEPVDSFAEESRGLGYDPDEVENYTDVFPNVVEQEWIPPFDPEIFERGPLAAGIRMLEALLTEARSGYITAQIDELARVLDIDPSPDERFFLARVAATERTASGLPDVAGAYQALVVAKGRIQG